MPDTEKILRRIKKCLALAESANEHEAALALRQAKALMDKHNISLNEALQDDIDIIDGSSGKRSAGSYTRVELQLHSIVCAFFGCSLFVRRKWPVIAGVSPAPDICEYAIRVLTRQLRAGRKAFVEEQEHLLGGKISPEHKRSINHAYSTAWIIQCREKIRDFSQGVTDEQQHAHQQAVEKYFNTGVVPNQRRRRVNLNSGLSALAYQYGMRDGQKAQLNHAMDGGKTGPRLLS